MFCQRYVLPPLKTKTKAKRNKKAKNKIVNL